MAPMAGKPVWRQRGGVAWRIFFGIFFTVIVVGAVLLWRESQKIIANEARVIGVVVVLEAVVAYAAYVTMLEIIRRPVAVYENGIDVANAPQAKQKFFIMAGVREHVRLRRHFFLWEDIVHLDKMKSAQGPYDISTGVAYVVKSTREDSFILRFGNEDEKEFHHALKEINAVQNIFTIQPPKFLKADVPGIEYRVNVKPKHDSSFEE